ATAPLPLVDVQAKSAVVEPTHLLWGVDSCKAFTGDPSGQELYPSVVSHLGTPEFWGRYLTNTVCPGISSSEVALAARQHLGILPIYNDYDCSAVSSYATGHSYAVSAVAAARNLGIPRGRVLAVDIEPPGDACPGAAYIDSAFIDGWYEGIHDAGYVPVFYGNGTQGSEFASAWCAAVAAVPTIATGSDLWTFQPSLLGSFNKTAAPNFSPYDPGCGGNMLTWQYVLSAGANPDVDQDEALSSLPLWYPS
ncbi:MAG TPA: glycoside hydrolase domain-containing protein, partial [Solirubrobacteraceae bacterium]|nr:glycoside hydrolase domain-containing protein [Solirubrobacteraceae bacterium]